MSKKINLGPVTAYAIAVENGFVGSVQEWLASLKGEKGDQGEKGEPGPQGPQGPEGPKGEQVQPDLTVNDPNDPRYVKGRTHWVEEEWRELLAEQELEFTEGGDSLCSSSVVSSEFANLAEGQKLKVVFDGREYLCTTITHSPTSDITFILAGNLSLAGFGEDTGEPFAMAIRSGYEQGEFVTSQSGTTHTIKISALFNVVHPIDPKYLPCIVFSASETGGIACNYDYEMTKKLIYNCSPIYAMAGTINTLEARPYTFMREMAITVTVTEGNDVETPFITIEFPTAGTLRYYSTGVIE